MASNRTAVLIVAAGKGLRAGAGIPKQYRPLAGASALERAVEAFLANPDVAFVRVLIHRDDASLYEATVPPHAKLLPPRPGGATRQETVRLGLRSLVELAPDLVLIHDAVRPFVDVAVIAAVLEGLRTFDAVLPVLPVVDTLQRVDGEGFATGTVSREGLAAAQTPQGFRFAPILSAHDRAAAAAATFTDDAAVALSAGLRVKAVPGTPGNVKLTTQEDVQMAEARLRARSPTELTDLRVGTGYDVHAFGPGRAVALGGISIAHDRGLVGHSDADVALHALTDAILGALAEGDIGAHFPPGDPAYKGASSDRFLEDAVRRVTARGGTIAHLDLAIVAEAPKIGPHRDAMRARIASICRVTVDRVAVKATTNEGLGFIGRKEGIAAIATATIRLPAGDRS